MIRTLPINFISTNPFSDALAGIQLVMTNTAWARFIAGANKVFLTRVLCSMFFRDITNSVTHDVGGWGLVQFSGVALTEIRAGDFVGFNTSLVNTSLPMVFCINEQRCFPEVQNFNLANASFFDVTLNPSLRNGLSYSASCTMSGIISFEFDLD